MHAHHKLIIACLGFIVGVAAAKYFVVASLFSSVLLLGLVAKNKIFSLLIFLSFVAIGGFWQEYQQGKQSLIMSKNGQEVTIKGRIRNDVVVNDFKALDFYIDEIEYKNQKIKGLIRVNTYDRNFKRFDLVEVSGKLKDGFGPYFASINFAEVKVVERNKSLAENIRKNFIKQTNQSLPANSASLSLGFLVGLRSQIDEDIDDWLRVAGLTHIIAVSGYNLTILANAIKKIFANISRRISLSLSLGFITFFTLVAERTPSIERAFIISFISLFVWYFGRKIKAYSLLIISAAVTLAINPTYIFGNVSWYLSFAAFWGVLVLAPAIVKRFYKNRQPKILSSIAIETLSAQIATLPIIILFFNKVPLYSLIANIFVLPLVPLVMIASFVGVISFGFVKDITLFVAHLLIEFIINFARLVSELPNSQIEIFFDIKMTIGLLVLILLFYKTLSLSVKVK